jgi:hypothetical protein
MPVGDPTLASRPARALLFALLSAACVSTARDDDAPALPLCAAPATAAGPSPSVVLVTADLENAGLLRCSGVVIAPTLVLTSLACVVLPARVAPIDVVTPSETAPFSGTRPLSDGLVDYSSVCDVDAGWAPREDGRFASRYGVPVPVSALTVSQREPPTETITTVRATSSSLADSPCWGALAILVLDVPVDLEPMPLRLDAPTLPGEPVVLSGFGSIGGAYQKHDIVSSVEASTLDAEGGPAPPRSLLLRGGVCDFESGGAVVSQQTGALIGIITSGTGEGCGEGQGYTVALRTAPFRRMLVQAAELAVESLRVEPSAEGLRWPPCASE